MAKVVITKSTSGKFLEIVSNSITKYQDKKKLRIDSIRDYDVSIDCASVVIEYNSGGYLSFDHNDVDSVGAVITFTDNNDLFNAIDTLIDP